MTTAVEYEVGCAVCRRAVTLSGGELRCPMHGVMSGAMLRQTGAKRRKQFEPWKRTRSSTLVGKKSVPFR